MTTLRALTLLLAILAPALALAQDWSPVLDAHSLAPETMLVVDKSRQRFLVLTRHSPLKIEKELDCTTGQSDGDKEQQGDLRTPEGVYFLEYRINRDLDYELYGTTAYSLNYPNPVDRLNGKTGSGIWLHGRGKELVPRDTRGCVALSDADIGDLRAELTYGMPVIITESVALSDAGSGNGGQALTLAEYVRQWGRDWQAKSDAFFTHYDPEKFTRTTGGSFQGFMDHKKNVFAAQPFIQVLVDNIHVLQGPDYWVTVFDQYYRTPSLTSTVGKRFYWQAGEDGTWRIVGREYIRASEDLSKKYLEAKREEIAPIITDWADAWEQADVGRYISHYHDRAEQDGRRGLKAIAEYKTQIWQDNPPKDVTVENIEVRTHQMGLEVRFTQRYENNTGFSDRGQKTLVMAPADRGWVIVTERWKKL